MHADVPVAGVDAFEDSPRRNRPHQLGKRCAFPTRGLNALLRSPSGGPASTARTGPSSGYILNGSTIDPSVTFLDGLTGASPPSRQALASPSLRNTDRTAPPESCASFA